MRNWLRQWLFPSHGLEEAHDKRAFEFPRLREIEGTTISIKEIHNGFLIAFNTQDEEEWRQKVTFCKTPDDLAHELVRYFTVKTMAKR